MSLEHDENALASYVVGALAAGERAEVEAHLARCAECAAEVQSLQRVAVALAHAVPLRTPRPELRARVLDTVRDRGRERHQTDRAARRATVAWSDSRVWLPFAALLLLVLGLGAHTARLQSRIASLESRLETALALATSAERAMARARLAVEETQSAMAVLAAPDLARIDLTGQAPALAASARALWSRQRGMVFTASNLPVPPSGRVYQVWVVTARAPISAGLLEPDASGRGMRVFSTPTDIPAPVAVAVTLEPAGGVSAPTGEIFLLGKPGPTL